MLSAISQKGNVLTKQLWELIETIQLGAQVKVQILKKIATIIPHSAFT